MERKKGGKSIRCTHFRSKHQLKRTKPDTVRGMGWRSMQCYLKKTLRHKSVFPLALDNPLTSVKYSNYFVGCCGDSLVGQRACCSSLRTWVPILSTLIKTPAWPHAPVTPVLNWGRQEDGRGLLGAKQFLARTLSQGNTASSDKSHPLLASEHLWGCIHTGTPDTHREPYLLVKLKNIWGNKNKSNFRRTVKQRILAENSKNSQKIMANLSIRKNASYFYQKKKKCFR